jgi:hypothetical protein
MPQPISQTLLSLSKQASVSPQLILRIENIPFIFGALPVLERARFDTGLLFDDGNFLDTPIQSEFSRDLISLDGSTRELNTQILVDEGGTGAVQSMRIKIIDKDAEATRIFNTVDELLGLRCEVFSGLQGGVFSDDTLRTMRGYVEGLESDATGYILTIQHIDGLKRQSLLTRWSSEITSAIDDNQTNIPVLTTSGLVLPDDLITLTLAKIGDEIVNITSITGNNLTVQRGFDGSIAQAHDPQAEIQSLYQIDGNPITIALKIMLSGGSGELFRSGFIFTATDIFFPYNIAQEHNPVIGDTLVITGTDSNDGSYQINTITELSNGYNVRVQGIVPESSGNGSIELFSKYNVSTTGLGLKNKEVDILEHERIREENTASIIDLSLKIKEEDINGKEFIEKELFRPFNIYALPINGIAGLKITKAPLPSESIVELNLSNVVNPEGLQPKRSTGKYYFNNLTYRYQRDYIEDGFFAGDTFINADSLNRIRVGVKKKKFESIGLIKQSETRNILSLQARRFFNRWQFAPMVLSGVRLTYATGFNVEVGDVLLVNAEELRIKNMPTQFMEVISRRYSLFNASFSIDLLATNFATNLRYGLFSPSDEVGSINGSKWENYIGQTLRARSEDYAFDIETVLLSISGDELTFADDITGAEIIELSNYVNASDDTKRIYSFNSAASLIVDSPGLDQVEVDSSTNYYVGQKVYIQEDEGYSLDEDELEIIDITGNVIQFDKNVTIANNNYDRLYALTFADQGDIYRFY